jgi:hypothetical protein
MLVRTAKPVSHMYTGQQKKIPESCTSFPSFSSFLLDTRPSYHQVRYSFPSLLFFVNLALLDHLHPHPINDTIKIIL